MRRKFDKSRSIVNELVIAKVNAACMLSFLVARVFILAVAYDSGEGAQIKGSSAIESVSEGAKHILKTKTQFIYLPVRLPAIRLCAGT